MWDWATREDFVFGEKRYPLASVLSQGIFSKFAFCRGKFPSVKIGLLLLVAGCVLREVVVVKGTLVRVVFL